MRQLVFLDSAIEDFADIFAYIARESEDVSIGRNFVNALQGHCREMALLPGLLGRARPELRSDIRSFAYKSYVIFFRYQNDSFEVVNVLEGHRDIDTYFKRQQE
jgi:toxin ParE1/3/4